MHASWASFLALSLLAPPQACKFQLRSSFQRVAAAQHVMPLAYTCKAGDDLPSGVPQMQDLVVPLLTPRIEKANISKDANSLGV